MYFFLLNLSVEGIEGCVGGGGFLSFRIAECFRQLTCFVTNLEVTATTVEMAQRLLDQPVYLPFRSAGRRNGKRHRDRLQAQSCCTQRAPGKQVEGGSPSPLHCPSETPSGVLCPVLGSPLQGR